MIIFFNDSHHAFVMYCSNCVTKGNFPLTMFETDSKGILFIYKYFIYLFNGILFIYLPVFYFIYLLFIVFPAGGVP